MARSIIYWHDIILAEKNTMSNLNALQPNIDSAQTLLSDVTTTSRVSRWRLWFWCVAACAFALDVLFDLSKLELEEIASKSRYGTEPWYAYVSKEYQHGHALTWIGSQFKYATNDDAAKIIKRASAVESLGIESYVNLKVATLVGAVVTPLDATQEAAFTAYIKSIKPPGVIVNIITGNPDDLKLYPTVLYDPLVLKADGESILTSGVFPVEDAILDYINNLPFNGTFEIAHVIDKIQAVNGVVSAYVPNAEARYGANPFVAFTERYVANVGHLTIHAGTPLNTSITYEANV